MTTPPKLQVSHKQKARQSEDFFCFKGANENNEEKYTCIVDKTIIIWHKLS